MSDNQMYTARPRQPRWVDLSPLHAEVRTQLEDGLRRFCEGTGAPAKSIVGAYGSGKSELMAWGFRYSWVSLGMPALYVNLETLLKQLPARMGPTDLVDQIGLFVTKQMDALRAELESEEFKGIPLAPDMRPGESLTSYLKDLFGDAGYDIVRVREILACPRVALFLDEIEQKYADLMTQVEASDQAPFRELLQKVEQGLVPFYLVMSFGLTSAYEAMSGADARRVSPLLIPIPDAKDLSDLVGDSQYRNFLWWASRGRPGWAILLNGSWVPRLPGIDRLEGFKDLAPSLIDSVPLLDTGTSSDFYTSSETNRTLTDLLKRLAFTRVGELGTRSVPAISIPNHLPQYQFILRSKDDRLVSVDQFVDAVMADLTSQAKNMNASDVDWQSMSYYLRKLVGAMASPDGKLALGGWNDKVGWLAQAVLAPLLVLLQDTILEFAGDQGGTTETLAFLDSLAVASTIVGNQATTPYELVKRFQKASQLFEEVYEVDENSLIAISPRAIENLFPRMVGRPLLALSREAKGTIKDQYTALEASVAASAQFLSVEKLVDSQVVEFLFVPGKLASTKLLDTVFDRLRRRTYLAGNKTFVLLPLGEDEGVELDPVRNSDLEVLRGLHKIDWAALGEKRLQDFVISLWHNAVADEVSVEDLFEVLDSFRSSPGLSKANRRKLDYYRERLDQRLLDLAHGHSRAYKRELQAQFDPDSSAFPEKRISDTLNRMRENRAIEQVALAFDIHADRAQALGALNTLRHLLYLRKQTKPPHAYGQFLEDFAVAGEGNDLRPVLGLDDMVRYIADNAGFTRLLRRASTLGLDPGPSWNDADAATRSAPILSLYPSLGPAQAIFVRGASFYSYLRANRDLFVDRSESLKQEAVAFASRLETLRGNVENFNKALGRNLINVAEIEDVSGELKALGRLLESAATLPPAALYVVFRFAESALQNAEEERQKWVGDRGLQGWALRLQPLLRSEIEVQDLMQEAEQLYEPYRLLKEQALGPLDQATGSIKKSMQASVQKVLKSLDQQYKLSDQAIPDVDVSAYRQALDASRKQLESLRGSARQIEQVADNLATIQSKVEALIQKLGE